VSWYELWLFLHLTAAMIWIGGGVAVQVFGILTQRAADPDKAAFFGRSTSYVVLRLFLPAALVVVLSGIGLVESGHWDWGEPFITLGLLLWAIVALVAFGFLGRAMGSAGAQLAAEGPSPALGLRLRNLVWLSRALLATLIVVVFLMVVKPGT
jgi:uncharacterized membrane protein